MIYRSHDLNQGPAMGLRRRIERRSHRIQQGRDPDHHELQKLTAFQEYLMEKSKSAPVFITNP